MGGVEPPPPQKHKIRLLCERAFLRYIKVYRVYINHSYDFMKTFLSHPQIKKKSDYAFTNHFMFSSRAIVFPMVEIYRIYRARTSNCRPFWVTLDPNVVIIRIFFKIPSQGYRQYTFILSNFGIIE